MLSEGWDAKNVTHIMGLRAFSSQLLCEQVVGRELRRTSYEADPDTGLFSPEYVDIFGVPFTFLPHESTGCNGVSITPTTMIMTDPKKKEHKMSWPNVDRIDIEYTPHLKVDWAKVRPLKLVSAGTVTLVEIDQIIAGKPVNKMSAIDLQELSKDSRLRQQRIIFLAAKDVYDGIKPGWRGNKDVLIAQIVMLVEQFIHQGKVIVTDVSGEPLRAKMTMLFNMQKIVAHVFKSMQDSNTESRVFT